MSAHMRNLGIQGASWAAAQLKDESILMESIAARIGKLQTVFAQLADDFVLQGDDPLSHRQQLRDVFEGDPFRFDRTLTLKHLRSSPSAIVAMPSFQRESDPAFEPSRGAYFLGAPSSPSKTKPLYRVLMANQATEGELEESWRLAKHIPFVAVLSHASYTRAPIGNRVLLDENEIASRAVCVIVGACSDEMSIFCVLDMDWWQLMCEGIAVKEDQRNGDADEDAVGV